MHGSRTTVVAVLILIVASGAAYRWTSGGAVTPVIPAIPLILIFAFAQDKIVAGFSFGSK